jgi:uncharacterized protein YjbI with pentapeptide repeats
MAGVEHLLLLRQGVEIWNQWRKKNPTVKPYLREAVLRRMDLSGANLRDANLRKADLSASKLVGADLRSADLFGANLVGADLSGRADLSSSDLRGANLQDVIGLTIVQIYGASTDEKTLLPDQLKAKKK